MILVLWNAVLLPYEAAFGGFDTKVWKVINWCIDLSFFVDIMLCFRTSYQVEQTGEVNIYVCVDNRVTYIHTAVVT
jgi:hypothetical protein